MTWDVHPAHTSLSQLWEGEAGGEAGNDQGKLEQHMELKSDPKSAQSASQRRYWLFELGAAASLVLLVLFLVGVTGLVRTGAGAAAARLGLASLQNNWLILLFKLNVGYAGVQAGLLEVLNPVDVLILALFGVLFLALYAALPRTSKLWRVIAACLPFLGLGIYLITNTAGRSALLMGAMIFSAVMLRSAVFSKGCAFTGFTAGALLLVGGDFGTAVFSSSIVIAYLIGVGYVLWMVWLFLVGRRLFQLAGLARTAAAGHVRA